MLGFRKNKRTIETRVEPEVVDRPTSVPQVNRLPRSRRGQRGARIGEIGEVRVGSSSTPLTADQIIDRNQRRLVAASRHEADNNDYMKNYLRLVPQNIVGHRGFTLQAQAKASDGSLDRDLNEGIEAWWRDWCRAENCDIKGRRSFRGICKSVARGTAKDGEFMIREIRGREAGPMRYALQTIDPQRCPVEYNIDRLPNGGVVRQGIEFNRVGRAVAYYFSVSDAGSTGYSFNGTNLERVPADEIIHGFLDEIEGQRRGIPWASTSLWRLNMLDGFEKSSLKNARAGAAVGGFIEWEDGFGPEPEEELEDEELFIEAEGGMFQELPPGARAKKFDSQYPSGEFAPFHKAMLRGAGAGMGVAYVSFANDLEGVNFSSIRQGVLDEREHWMDLQEWLIEVLIDRVYRGAIKPALLLGLIKSAGQTVAPQNLSRCLNVFWQARRWAWVDPVKDVNAEVISKNNMLTAPSQIIRKRGDDPDTVWRTYATDIQSMQAAGMPDAFIMAAVLGVQPPGTAAPEIDGDDTNTKEDDDNEDENND